jgi:hypothetical protein
VHSGVSGSGASAGLRATGVQLVYVLALVALGLTLALFRRLQTTAFHSIQLASTLGQVADRGREVIDHLYAAADRTPHPVGEPSDAHVPRRDVISPDRARCCR